MSSRYYTWKFGISVAFGPDYNFGAFPKINIHTCVHIWNVLSLSCCPSGISYSSMVHIFILSDLLNLYYSFSFLLDILRVMQFLRIFLLLHRIPPLFWFFFCVCVCDVFWFSVLFLVLISVYYNLQAFSEPLRSIWHNCIFIFWCFSLYVICLKFYKNNV